MDLTTHDPTSPPSPDAVHAEDAYASFLEQMEELGLLEDLDDELPPDFSAIFEIGRILASPHDAIGRALSSALELRQADLPEEQPESDEPESRISVPAAEEYEAEFIRTWSDVQYAYSWQWLLPDEVFLRRLAQRLLWFPMAKAPRIKAIEGGDDGFLPSPSKQRVYVLFDTSASMALHHRFAFAKAIVMRFLRENRRELGEVFLRTFDADLGPLELAKDSSSYAELLRAVARRRTLGNGTCLERAILQACRDIRDRKALSGAEILVVTDGAAHVDAYAVRAALGRDIELHCVKLGHVSVSATDRWIDDQLEYGHEARTARERWVLQIRERRARLEYALRHERDELVKKGLREGLRDCDTERAAIAREIREEYGHEIESLAHVYVQVPDLDPAALALSPEQIASLERLARSLLEQLGPVAAPPYVLKQAALLLSHIAMLAADQEDAEVRARLEALRSELEKHLTQSVEAHGERVLDAGLLSPADQRDLRVLLRRGIPRTSSLWLALMHYVRFVANRLGLR